MKAVVVYESMFGSTREVAEAIGEGLSSGASVAVVNVNHAEGSAIADVDLLVVGGPTHVHGLSRPESRAEAVEWTKARSKNLRLEPEAPGIGIREWLPTLTVTSGQFAAFDTRADFPRILSGAASAAIDRALRKLGLHRVVAPASFLISTDGRIEPGEVERARAWGESIALKLSRVE
jgi:hypothetical protein